MRIRCTYITYHRRGADNLVSEYTPGGTTGDSPCIGAFYGTSLRSPRSSSSAPPRSSGGPRPIQGSQTCTATGYATPALHS